MGYTDEEREEAIEACAMMASSNSLGWLPACYFGDAIDTSCRAAELARAALWTNSEGNHYYREELSREDWAAAEVLLRDGWSPGDPLIVLATGEERR